MALPQNLIPIRWPGGPLEIARRQTEKSFTALKRQLLEYWQGPASLDLLTGTPMNCLVLGWAGGRPEDGRQQKALALLVEVARKRHIETVGWVDGSADHPAAIAAARAAGLSAVAIQGYKGAPDPLVIPYGGRTSAPWDSSASVLPVTENVWPGVQLAPGAAADASASPTGVPWLDSNGWYAQMARARTRAEVWLMFDPPGENTVLGAAEYSLAICDAEAAGGRWVISLDDALRAGLMEGDSSARETWQAIALTAGFFRDHREWSSYRSLGLMGVLSDFAGENFDMSGEILNLMSRRDLLFRVILKSEALAQSFSGLKALTYADAAKPEQALRREIMTFVEQGGLLITGPGWGNEGRPATLDFNTQFEVRDYGKGRLAVAKSALSDPYQVAVEAQFLLSHRYDQVKIFNSSSSGCTRLSASPDGQKALLQSMTYATGRASAPRTVWVRERRRSARLWAIGSEPVPLPAAPSEDYEGAEYHLPAKLQQAYIALEFEG